MENLEDLLLIGFRVLLNLFGCQLFPRCRAARWIADQSGEVTDKKNDRVSKVLEMLHLPDKDRMAEMNVRRCGIETSLHPQWFSGFLRALQLLDQFFLTDDLDGAPANPLELFLDRNCFEISDQT